MGKMPKSHDFSGTVEDWEQRVFDDATHFRVHRFHGRGKQDHMQTDTFAEACAAAEEALQDGFRVIIYAVTEAGRAIALPDGRWEYYKDRENKISK